MVLFSNGATEMEISNYFNVEYDTVIKELQTFTKKYNVSSVEQCKQEFIKDYLKDKTYISILDSYAKFKNSSFNYGKYYSFFKNDISKKEEQNNLGLSVIDLRLVDSNKEKKYIDIEELSKIVNDAIKFHKKIKIMYYGTNKKYLLIPLSFYEKNGKSYLKAIDTAYNQVKLFNAGKIGKIELI